MPARRLAGQQAPPPTMVAALAAVRAAAAAAGGDDGQPGSSMSEDENGSSGIFESEAEDMSGDEMSDDRSGSPDAGVSAEQPQSAPSTAAGGGSNSEQQGALQIAASPSQQQQQQLISSRDRQKQISTVQDGLQAAAPAQLLAPLLWSVLGHGIAHWECLKRPLPDDTRRCLDRKSVV